MSGVRSTFVVNDIINVIVVIFFVTVDVSFKYFVQVCRGTRSAVETLRQLGFVPTNAEEARHSHQLPSSTWKKYPCFAYLTKIAAA